MVRVPVTQRPNIPVRIHAPRYYKQISKSITNENEAEVQHTDFDIFLGIK